MYNLIEEQESMRQRWADKNYREKYGKMPKDFNSDTMTIREYVQAKLNN